MTARALARPVVALASRRGADALSAEPAVRVHAVEKRFAERRGFAATLRRPFAGSHVPALAGVSLAVAAGECYGLLGPNGAGKSTLFKVLATLILPDAGQVTVCGLDVVDDAAAVRAQLASAIPDERSLYWRLSAGENLRLYASLYALRGAERSARVAEVLGVVGLGAAGRQLVGSFSSGMRQRLLIARALLPRPRVLLLDEPTRSLDPVLARDFRHFLREEIIDRQRCTVLVATHSADEAFELCDRVGILHRGRLLAEGPAATLAAAYTAGRYDLFTDTPGHPALHAAALAEIDVRRLGERPADEQGWTCVELQIGGGRGNDDSAAVVARLTTGGVRVARMEGVRPSLAALLERVVADEGGVRPPDHEGERHA